MKRFLNPYNFISFPSKKASAYKSDRTIQCHTGVIHYTVETVTPLFIPNSSADEVFSQSKEVVNVDNEESKKHHSYDFFSYTELANYTDEKGNPKAPVPVIPGSEMRGVIRSIYETLTDSCMGVLNSEVFPVKRSADIFKPALIKKVKNGYRLIKAKSYRIGDKAREGELPPGFEDKSNGTHVYFEYPGIGGRGNRRFDKCIANFGYDEDSYEDDGYLMKWGMGGGKSRYHIFSPKKDNGKEIYVSNVALSREVLETKLYGVIDSYKNQPSVDDINIKAYEEYENDLKKFLQGLFGKKEASYFPVCYSRLGNGMFYLSPSIFSKEISNNSIKDLAGDFAPCDGVVECPACELFGRVSENNDNSKGSKIRFSDLNVTDKKDNNEEYYYNLLTLPALSSPKVSNTEFYLKKPDKATFWTYDYYVADGKVNITPGQLRGRKYYWHHPDKDILKKIPNDIEPSNMNKTVRPLREKVTFSGEIYYENITEKQLKQLVWICNGGKKTGSDENSVRLGYKLGAAKPFGFGSIECRVTSVEERSINIQAGKLVYKNSGDLKEQYESSYENAGFSVHCKEQFYKIANLDALKEAAKNNDIKISYPRTSRQMADTVLDEGFRWFVENHKTVSGEGMPSKRKHMWLCRNLPSLDEKDVSLPYESIPYTIPEVGIVQGVSDDGKLLIVQTENSGRKIKIHFSHLYKGKEKERMPTEYPPGTRLKISYNGKDNRGYSVERCK